MDKGRTRTKTTRRFAALLLVLALSACSWLPLPATVDLRARLGQQASGSYRTIVAAADPSAVDAKLPGAAGDAVDFSDETPPVTVEWGELRYDIALAYDGPPLSGNLQALLYVAPNNGENLWQPKYRLGLPLALNLDRSKGQLTGRAALNQDQILALNEGQLRYGVWISGKGVGVEEGGKAVFHYTVHVLELQLGVAVF